MTYIHIYNWDISARKMMNFTQIDWVECDIMRKIIILPTQGTDMIHAVITKNIRNIPQPQCLNMWNFDKGNKVP